MDEERKTMEEEEPVHTMCFERVLPAEMWTLVFNNLSTLDKARLRVVSVYFKQLIDEHQMYKISLTEESKDFTFPGHHLKIEELILRNIMTETTPVPSAVKLASTSTFTVIGVVHPSLVQHVLANAPLLKRIEIDAQVAVDMMDGLDVVNSVYCVKSRKVEDIKVHKHTRLMFSHPTLDLVKRELVWTSNFTKLVKGLLAPGVYLPCISQLTLKYVDLPLFTLTVLIHSIILPFVCHHSKTLKMLTLDLTAPRFQHKESALAQQEALQAMIYGSSAIKKMVPKPLEMQVLAHLTLVLPETILNNVLQTLFNGNHEYNATIPTNVLQSLFCQWEKPYRGQSSENINNTQPFGLVHEIISKNQSSLATLSLENVDTRALLLFDHVGITSKKFTHLQDIQVGGRAEAREMSNMRTMNRNFQVKLLVPSRYPSLCHVYLHDMSLKITSLKNALLGCPLLLDLTLRDNVYKDDDKVDSLFLSAIVAKPGMREIVMGRNDLCACFRDSPHWDDFKLIPVQRRTYNIEIGLFIRV